MTAHPDAGCVRVDCAGKSTPGAKPGVRTCDPRWWYFVTCQAAVWRKEILRGLLREHEDACQFERWASKRARLTGCRFFALEPANGRWPVRYLKTGVIQGKWFEPVVELFRKHGIAMDSRGADSTKANTDASRAAGSSGRGRGSVTVSGPSPSVPSCHGKA